VSLAASAFDARRAEQGLPPLPQLKPESLRTEARDAVRALNPDLLLSFAYGRIFGPKFLALFPQGGLNIHPSLLPCYRGPTPLSEAIIRGDAETGVSIQRIALEVDSGDLLLQTVVPLRGDETTGSLSETVSQKAAELLPDFLRDFVSGRVATRPQEGKPSYTRLISREDGRINWSLSAVDIARRVRAYSPWPLCYTRHEEKTLYIIEGKALSDVSAGSVPAGTVLGKEGGAGVRIQTGNGIFAATRLQYQSKKVLLWKDFLNGARNFIGAVLK
jgi:methionyl-tRNA formyltransferase